MVAYSCMDRRILTVVVPVGLACLVFIPNPAAWSASFHDEALASRAQGYEAQQRGDLATALALYRRAAAMDATYPVPLNDIGILLEDMGQLEEAEQSYLQAITLSPYYLSPQTNVAMLYERMGQKEKAAYYWLKRAQLGEPDDPWTSRARERAQALGIASPPAPFQAASAPASSGPPVIYRPFEPATKPETAKTHTPRHVLDREFHEQEQSVKEFSAVTAAHGYR